MGAEDVPEALLGALGDGVLRGPLSKALHRVSIGLAGSRTG